MKVAITSMDNTISGKISDVFGRCAYFIIVDVENKDISETKIIENKSINQMGGAGVSSAQLVAEEKVQAVITKNMGPRAIDVLNQFNIEVYSGEGLIKEVLQKFIDRRLRKIN